MPRQLQTRRKPIRVFVSRADVDVKRAEELEAWIDHHFQLVTDRGFRFGDEIHAAVLRSIDESAVVLVLWSRESVRSDWVLEEAHRGAEARKLIGAKIEECKLPPKYRYFNFADLSDWDGGLADPRLLKLNRDIESLALPPPRRWPLVLAISTVTVVGACLFAWSTWTPPVGAATESRVAAKPVATSTVVDKEEPIASPLEVKQEVKQAEVEYRKFELTDDGHLRVDGLVWCNKSPVGPFDYYPRACGIANKGRTKESGLFRVPRPSELLSLRAALAQAEPGSLAQEFTWDKGYVCWSNARENAHFASAVDLGDPQSETQRRQQSERLPFVLCFTEK